MSLFPLFLQSIISATKLLDRIIINNYSSTRCLSRASHKQIPRYPYCDLECKLNNPSLLLKKCLFDLLQMLILPQITPIHIISRSWCQISFHCSTLSWKNNRSLIYNKIPTSRESKLIKYLMTAATIATKMNTNPKIALMTTKVER